MERPERPQHAALIANQPYDESLEAAEAEEVTSVYSPEPRRQSESRRSRRGRGLMSAHSDEPGDERRPLRTNEPMSRRRPGEEEEEDDEDEEEEEETDEEDSDEDDDDDEDPSRGPEGAYDPAEYANLPVSTDIKELFQYISRYSPQVVELDHSLKPFIPDFIPAVGDIDAFLKVPRPDGKADSLGLLVLDEPSVKQSEPTVLSLFLTEESKHDPAAELKKVTSVPSPQSHSRVLDSWVESISALHRCKPAASVQYGRAMPDADTLMQEWPPEVEELLGRLRPPSAHLDVDVARYADVVCGLLDIPVHGSRIQSLHLLFSLYLLFRDSAHFSTDRPRPLQRSDK